MGVVAALWLVLRPAVGSSDALPASIAVLQAARPWTYIVQGKDARGGSLDLASGVRLEGGAIVTNWHAVGGAAALTVRQAQRIWPATVLACDRNHDLCLLRAPDQPRAGARLRAAPARAGEPVFAVGSPEGLELVISGGLAAGMREIENTPMLVATVPTSAGSSGGGVFDVHAQLVGIIADQIANGEDLSLAIPASQIAALAGRTRTGPMRANQ